MIGILSIEQNVKVMQRERCERQADDDCSCNVAPVGLLVGLHGWPFSWLVGAMHRKAFTYVMQPLQGKILQFVTGFDVGNGGQFVG